MFSKRGYLTGMQYEDLLARQGLGCATFGCVNPGPFQADHVIPLCLGGTNEEANFQLLCKRCHIRKTARDVAMKAKADRQAGRTGQWAKRKRHGPKMWAAAKRIVSRGFDKALRKRMNGEVIKRG